MLRYIKYDILCYFRLLLSLIILEYEVNSHRKDDQSQEKNNENHHSNDMRYVSGKPIPQQPLFYAAVSFKALILFAIHFEF